MNSIFQNKTILVLGGAGSIGSEIVRKLLQHEPKSIRVLDNNETALFELEQDLNSRLIRPFIGDIKDKDRLKRATEDVNIIFHAAALKHVPLCEYNPFEAVKTNVIGTQNIIEVAIDADVEKMITISSDKAVNPANVMGATKLLGERLTISANHYKGLRKTAFSCVRFGNVLNSRGSVIPVFKEQIQKGGPVTITDPDMTRFIMSIPKAVDLVLKAAEMTKGGEIFIFKMPALRVKDLADVLINEFAPVYGYQPEKIKTQIIGTRAGEKNYEELMTCEEKNHSTESENMYIIMPNYSLQKEEKRNDVSSTHSSEKIILLSTDQILLLLKDLIN